MNSISTTIPDRRENTLNHHPTVIGRTDGADSYDLTSILDAMSAAQASESQETEQAERQRMSRGWRVLGNRGNPLVSFGLWQLSVAADKPIRSDLKKQIEGLLETAGSANWDGEGAIAVTRKSVDVAQELVDLLPSNTGDPDVAATPHGEIDLDWIAGRDSMFTLSICPEGKLAWASLFDDFTCRGTAVWKGELPCPVGCCLQKFG